MAQLDKFCIVCETPQQILRDEEHRLHSEIAPAIVWSDTYEQHYLFGVYFDKELWEKVVKKEMSFKDIMSIENIEQRMASMKIYGAKELLGN